MKNLSMILTFLVLFLLSMEKVHGFDCGAAETSLLSCKPFLIGQDNKPPTSCCLGVRFIESSAPTVEERRAACECLKRLANQISNFRDDLAASLPELCGVHLGYTISRHMDCNK